MTDKRAFYFGCLGGLGHYLFDQSGREVRDRDIPQSLPWSLGLMDTGLLKNGRHIDACDGRVFWTCGGRFENWFAFFWWDRSVDSRPGSNSGLYVAGFSFPDAAPAFEHGCLAFPAVVRRQKIELVLQNKVNGVYVG